MTNEIKVGDKVKVVEGGFGMSEKDPNFNNKIFKVIEVNSTGYYNRAGVKLAGHINKGYDDFIGMSCVELVEKYSNKPKMGVFKLRDDAETPFYATKGSACFDLRLAFDHVTLYSPNFEEAQEILSDVIKIKPKERVVFGTGLILDIPEGYQVKLHVRSSTGIKKGLTLSNVTGIIDSDYVDELLIALTNNNNYDVEISSGDLLVQGELVEVIQCEFEELTERPKKKTDREGGIGSTGG